MSFAATDKCKAETTNAPLSVLPYIFVQYEIIERVLKGVKVLRCKICNLTHQHNLLSEKYTALPQAWRKRLDSFAELDVEFESSFSRFFLAQLCQKKERIYHTFQRQKMVH